MLHIYIYMNIWYRERYRYMYRTQYRIVGTVRSTVHVPSDTLRTWKWSPTRGGECYPRWILQINREVENERKPKNPIFDLCFTRFFHKFTKSRIWSYCRYAHSGIRVRPKTRQQNMFTTKFIYLKNSSLKPKAWFVKKIKKIDEFYIWQMGLECHTRSKSNPIYQIR